MHGYGITCLDGYRRSENTSIVYRFHFTGVPVKRGSDPIGLRFTVWTFLTPALFITSIHRLCTPLAIKHSATALTCSPYNMIYFNFGCRRRACLVMYVILWLRQRQTTLTETGFGLPSQCCLVRSAVWWLASPTTPFIGHGETPVKYKQHQRNVQNISTKYIGTRSNYLLSLSSRHLPSRTFR